MYDEPFTVPVLLHLLLFSSLGNKIVDAEKTPAHLTILFKLNPSQVLTKLNSIKF